MQSNRPAPRDRRAGCTRLAPRADWPEREAATALDGNRAAARCVDRCMEETLIWVFDHATPFFGTLIVLGLGLAAAIGRPRRWFHWAGTALAAGTLAIAVAALVLFGSIRGALERRVSSVSFVSAGGRAPPPRRPSPRQIRV